jgi:hypothetical protein
MPRKGRAAEQIIGLLRQAEVELTREVLEAPDGRPHQRPPPTRVRRPVRHLQRPYGHRPAKHAAPPYGYRKIRRFDEQGEPVRGRREIDPRGGRGDPSHFCRLRRGPQPPCHRGGAQCRGHSRPARNTLARHRHPRARQAPRRHPAQSDLCRSAALEPQPVAARSRDRASRSSPASSSGGGRGEVPELRVIDDTLWERAQARLYKEVAPEVDRSVAAFRERRRPKHLLSGKVVCGTFATLGKDYLGCQRAPGAAGAAPTPAACGGRGSRRWSWSRSAPG